MKDLKDFFKKDAEFSTGDYVKHKYLPISMYVIDRKYDLIKEGMQTKKIYSDYYVCEYLNKNLTIIRAVFHKNFIEKINK